jgi:hypothetical protein
LHALNLQFENKVLLDGQSADFAILDARKTLIAVNRTGADRNFRIVSHEDGKLNIGEQLSLDFMGVGDPGSALWLDERHILFSGVSSGEIWLYDFDERVADQVVFEKKLDPFRPVSTTSIDGKVYIVHQGLGTDFQANGSQRILVATWDKDKNSLLISDQIIALNGSVPGKITKLSDGTFVVASWCSQYVGDSCKSAVEQINFNENTATLKVDLDDLNREQINNTFVHADGSFYAGNEKNEARFFSKFTFEDDANVLENDVHKYEKKDSYTGLFGAFSNGSDLLFIGEAVDETNGRFVIYKDLLKIETLETESIPSLSGIYLE